MGSQRKPKVQETFFYVFWFEDSDRAFASPVDPISLAKARRLGGCRCSEESGVCFQERGPSWFLTDKIVVDKRPTNEIICQSCLIREPRSYLGPRGREDRTAASMLFSVKDDQDLLLQVKLWKSGNRLLKLVRTKYGEVAVFRKKAPEIESSVLTCPHCKQSIEVLVKENHSA